MKITNVSGQTLFFPNNTEVKRGQDYVLTDSDKANVAVKEWLKDKWIVVAEKANS